MDEVSKAERKRLKRQRRKEKERAKVDECSGGAASEAPCDGGVAKSKKKKLKGDGDVSRTVDAAGQSKQAAAKPAVAKPAAVAAEIDDLFGSLVQRKKEKVEDAAKAEADARVRGAGCGARALPCV
jgi:hypothetical protein